MAEVFLARRDGPAGFRKDLVIKRLLPHRAASPGFVRLFLREARLAARIDHPNLVHVSDFGEVDGEYYLAMEYVAGLTLKALIRRVGVLSSGVATRLAIDVLEGLEAVHTATDDDGIPLGLVHRDVNPNNVMVTRSAAVKLLDLGIAGALEDGAPHMGTQAFMAPEQRNGQPQDARADLYSVGRLLHFMVFGFVPSPDTSLDPSTAPDAVPDALWQIVCSALSTAREDRPQSARQMQRSLERFASTRAADGTRAHLADLLASVMPEPRSTSAPELPLGHTVAVSDDLDGLLIDSAPGPSVATERRRSMFPMLPMLGALGAGAVVVGGLAVSVDRDRDAEAVAIRADLVSAKIAEKNGRPLEPVPAVAAPPPRAPPPAVVRRAPRPTGVGRLTIDTQPWTEVFIGDRKLGMTPLSGARLPAGRVELRLVNRDAGIDTTLRVRVRAGRVTRIRRAL